MEGSQLSLKSRKVIFQQYYSYILQIIYVISEENKLLLPYPPPLKMSLHYLVKCTNFSSFSFLRVSSTNPRSGQVAEAFIVTWAEFQQNVVDDAVGQWRKDWKHVSVKKMVTLNICCNVACLTFHLPHITTGSFQSHQCQQTNGFLLREHMRGRSWES